MARGSRLNPMWWGLPVLLGRPPAELPDLRRVGMVSLDPRTKDDGLLAEQRPRLAVGRRIHLWSLDCLSRQWWNPRPLFPAGPTLPIATTTIVSRLSAWLQRPRQRRGELPGALGSVVSEARQSCGPTARLQAQRRAGLFCGCRVGILRPRRSVAGEHRISFRPTSGPRISERAERRAGLHRPSGAPADSHIRTRCNSNSLAGCEMAPMIIDQFSA